MAHGKSKDTVFSFRHQGDIQLTKFQEIAQKVIDSNNDVASKTKTNTKSFKEEVVEFEVEEKKQEEKTEEENTTMELPKMVRINSITSSTSSSFRVVEDLLKPETTNDTTKSPSSSSPSKIDQIAFNMFSRVEKKFQIEESKRKQKKQKKIEKEKKKKEESTMLEKSLTLGFNAASNTNSSSSTSTSFKKFKLGDSTAVEEDPSSSSNWALLWSDILTFSRSLKITKKSRSTYLKRYF